MTKTHLQKLAEQVREMFVRDTRTNGDEFYKRTATAPEWVEEMCHKAHGDMLPDDWKYSFIVDALDSIAEHDDPDTARDEIEPAPYHHTRLAWLSSHGERSGYVDEAVQQGYVATENFDVMEAIGCGMVLEAQEVFDSVRQALEDRLEAKDEEETED